MKSSSSACGNRPSERFVIKGAIAQALEMQREIAIAPDEIRPAAIEPAKTELVRILATVTALTSLVDVGR